MFILEFASFISRLGLEVTPQSQLKEEAPGVMQQLMSLVQYTAVSIFLQSFLL